MPVTRPNKGHYTEAETAQMLGITVEELRSLVRKHILLNEEDAANLPITAFQPSDLLLLRLLVRGQVATAAA
jgi:hypothetical protein